eukprot:jgi/Botrbrau1/15127/Bobra.0283s0006.1
MSFIFGNGSTPAPTVPLPHPWEPQWPGSMAGFPRLAPIQQQAYPPNLFTMLLLAGNSSGMGAQLPAFQADTSPALGTSPWQYCQQIPQAQQPSLPLLLQIRDALQSVQHLQMRPENQPFRDALPQQSRGALPQAGPGATGVFLSTLPLSAPSLGWSVADAASRASMYSRPSPASHMHWDPTSGGLQNKLMGMDLLLEGGRISNSLASGWQGGRQHSSLMPSYGNQWDSGATSFGQAWRPPAFENTAMNGQFQARPVDSHNLLMGRAASKPSSNFQELFAAVGYFLAANLPVGTMQGVSASAKVLKGRLLLLMLLCGDRLHSFAGRMLEYAERKGLLSGNFGAPKATIKVLRPRQPRPGRVKEPKGLRALSRSPAGQAPSQAPKWPVRDIEAKLCADAGNSKGMSSGEARSLKRSSCSANGLLSAASPPARPSGSRLLESFNSAVPGKWVQAKQSMHSPGFQAAVPLACRDADASCSQHEGAAHDGGQQPRRCTANRGSLDPVKYGHEGSGIRTSGCSRPELHKPLATLLVTAASLLAEDHPSGRRPNPFLKTEERSRSPAANVQEPRRKYLGVGFKPKTQRWYAQLRNGKEYYWLGCNYTTPEEAARAYDRLARKLRGPQTQPVNFPLEDDEGPDVAFAHRRGVKRKQMSFCMGKSRDSEGPSSPGSRHALPFSGDEDYLTSGAMETADSDGQRYVSPSVRRGTSRYRGVCRFNPKSGPSRWKAQIVCAGQVKHLGYFATEEDAARAFDRSAVVLRGPTAELNFPLENTGQI